MKSLALFNCTEKPNRNGLKYDPIEDTDKYKSVIEEARRKAHIAMGWPETDEKIDSLRIELKNLCDSINTEIAKEEERLETLVQKKQITSKDSARLKQLKEELEVCFDRQSNELPRFGSCHAYWKTLQKILKTDYNIKWHTPKEMNPDVTFD